VAPQGNCGAFQLRNRLKKGSWRMNMIKKFWNDETGLELSEYAVAAALVALAAVAAFTALGGKISGAINNLGSKIQ